MRTSNRIGSELLRASRCGYFGRPPFSVFLAILFCASAHVGFAAERPNIVWIFVEDMNGWMGCYGDDTVPTPNIDRLAASGVRFDRAYMPAGVCSATRSAIALGAMQTSLGVHNHRSSRQRVPGEVIHLPEGVQTVYEIFRQHGYYVYNGGGKNDFNFVWDIQKLYDFDGRRIGFGGPYWRKRRNGQPFFAQIQLRGGKNTGNFDGSQKSGENDTDTDSAMVEVPPYYPDHPIMRRETQNLADNPEFAGFLKQHREILETWIQETDDKGQYPESDDALRGVLTRWSQQAVNPEYDKVRDE